MQNESKMTFAVKEEKSCNFEEGEVLEVVRMVEGGDKVTSCIDSEGNVVVSTVYKAVAKESLEEEEGGKEKEEADTEKEVWVAEGEARMESLALPGGREATALYQVPDSIPICILDQAARLVDIML